MVETLKCAVVILAIAIQGVNDTEADVKFRLYSCNGLNVCFLIGTLDITQVEWRINNTEVNDPSDQSFDTYGIGAFYAELKLNRMNISGSSLVIQACPILRDGSVAFCKSYNWSSDVCNPSEPTAIPPTDPQTNISTFVSTGCIIGVLLVVIVGMCVCMCVGMCVYIRKRRPDISDPEVTTQAVQPQTKSESETTTMTEQTEIESSTLTSIQASNRQQPRPRVCRHGVDDTTVPTETDLDRPTQPFSVVVEPESADQVQNIEEEQRPVEQTAGAKLTPSTPT